MKPIKRKLSPPIDRLRERAGMSALRAAVLVDKLEAAQAVARRDAEALRAAEARRAAKRSPGYRAFRDAERSMQLGSETQSGWRSAKGEPLREPSARSGWPERGETNQ